MRAAGRKESADNKITRKLWVVVMEVHYKFI
jgi:hypothetical protein